MIWLGADLVFGLLFPWWTKVVITKCFHLFCNPCVLKITGTRQRKCPTCSASFGPNDIKPIYIWWDVATWNKQWKSLFFFCNFLFVAFFQTLLLERKNRLIIVYKPIYILAHFYIVHLFQSVYFHISFVIFLCN